MDDVLNFLLDIVELLQQPIVGILTMYAMLGLKKMSSWIAARAPVIQQLFVPILAWGFTELGGLLNLVLPTDLAVWDASIMSATISAGIAYAIHAGRRIRQATATTDPPPSN